MSNETIITRVEDCTLAGTFGLVWPIGLEAPKPGFKWVADVIAGGVVRVCHQERIKPAIQLSVTVDGVAL